MTNTNDTASWAICYKWSDNHEMTIINFVESLYRMFFTINSQFIQSMTKAIILLGNTDPIIRCYKIYNVTSYHFLLDFL